MSHTDCAAGWERLYDETLDQYYYLNKATNSVSFDTPCEVHYTPTDMSIASSSSSTVSGTSGRGLLRFRRSLLKISSSNDIHSTSGSSYKSQKLNNTCAATSSVLRKIKSGLLRKSLSKSVLPSSPVSETDSREYVFGEDELRRHPEFVPFDAMSPATYPTEPHTPPLEFDDLFLLPNFEDARFGNFAGTSGAEYDSEYEQDDDDSSSIQSSIDSIHSLYGHIQYIYTDDLYDKKSMANFDKEEERRQLREQMLRELEA